VLITRIIRGDVQFVPHTDLRLHFGDVLSVVGTKESLERIEPQIGNSMAELNLPQILPLFLGIILGVLVGTIPFHIPGVPIPVKLGLAGGPLLMSIIMGRLQSLGPIVWYLPPSSNLVLREIGIVLFLSCVGIKSGADFVSTITHGDGLQWMLYGAFITLIPMLIVAPLAYKYFKENYLTICGLISGSMTDSAALSFASTLADSPAPQLAYATVYPLVLILRVFFAQLLILLYL
jgi:putative transport protein